jgi:hypothetical protein
LPFDCACAQLKATGKRRETMKNRFRRALACDDMMGP